MTVLNLGQVRLLAPRTPLLLHKILLIHGNVGEDKALDNPNYDPSFNGIGPGWHIALCARAR